LAEEMAEQEQHMAMTVSVGSGHVGPVTEADVAALAHGIPGKAGTAVMGMGGFTGHGSPNSSSTSHHDDDDHSATNVYHPPPPSHLPQPSSHDDSPVPTTAPTRTRGASHDSVSLLAQQVLAVLGAEAVNSVGGLPSGAVATGPEPAGSGGAPSRGRGVSVYAAAVASEANGAPSHPPGSPNPMDVAFASLAAELAAQKAATAAASSSSSTSSTSQ
jgi:hypothetical protein